MVFTVEEVAERWKVHPATVYKLVKAGKLKAFRVQRVFRIRMDDLEEYENGSVGDE
jgi:excisionase family DNA binding protein